MEVPTEVGNATLEEPLGEEQSVDGDRRAVRCQNRARAYRVMVDDRILEVHPDEVEDLPEEKLEAFEDLIQKVPPDEGQDQLEIEDDEFKIIKEKFLHLNNDTEVVFKKSRGYYKNQSCLD